MKIGILDICWKEIEQEPGKQVLGGSETWLVQISKEFANQGHDVHVYCLTKNEFKWCNVLFYPIDNFGKEKFDFIILNRFLSIGDVNYIKVIYENKLANHVYMQIHDLSITENYRLLTDDEFNSKYSKYINFVTLVALNDWHKNNTLLQYDFKNSICAPNGIVLEDFSELNTSEKDNRILWSSCEERGLDILVNDIYPLVKKEVPDFGIDIAGYNEYSNNSYADKDVKYIGRLQKRELYKEMSKHKCWFYPGTFAETFCLTMLENVLCGNKVVSPLTYGMHPTIGYAEELKMKNNFIDNKNEAIKEAAEKIIEVLKGKTNNSSVYNKVIEKIHKEYNWKNTVDIYINDYVSNSYELKKDKKILILSMSCNNPYFKSLLSVVKDTWAKSIINKEYENVEWFAYTSCDKKHPVPEIDYNDHIIYVDAKDDLYSTYDKTQKAYNMIKKHIDFDFVVRTNTSVYLNIDNLISKIQVFDKNTVLGGVSGYYHVYPNGERVFRWNMIAGLFMCMPKEYFDVAISATNNYDTIPAPDDVIISGKLFEEFPNISVENPNEKYTEIIYPRYKCVLDSDYNKYIASYPHEMKQYTNNPAIIKECIVVQLRPLYGDLKERSEKGHEFEHFYELYDAID